MKKLTSTHYGSLPIALALAGAFLSSTTTTQANVYATDIKVAGVLTNGPVSLFQGSPAAISYILNEPATLGVSISIQSSSTNTRTITISAAAGTNGLGTSRGTNIVTWDGKDLNGHYVGLGNYSFSITAAATGYTNWTQISVDTASGAPAYYPLGIDVDKNITSAYYGRVVMGCALHGGTGTNVPVAAQMDGLYKMNADGTQADEGWYGNANYLADDGGDAPVTGQMPSSGGYNPMKIRIADDDRVYWVDNTDLGAISACDMQATTNQLVINESGYSSNPDYSDLGSIGFQVFDVAFVTTTNAAVYLGDNNYPSWGYWMFHMTNGAVDPNDYYGTQVVETGGDLAIVSSAGCTIDTNLDFFCGQARNNENAFYDAMLYSNWNGGILPPENSVANYVMGSSTGQVAWGYGCGVDTTCANDPSFESSEDTVINSRINPTMVACPLGVGSQFVLNKTGGGIRLLNAQTGALITVTNGANITTLSNLDNGQAYTCAAWDNVGNLYGGSTTRNVWRVYSPPGANTNVTPAVELLSIQAAPTPVQFATIPVTGAPSAPLLHFSGPASTTYHIWSTTNLALKPVVSTWTLVTTGTFSGGADTYLAPATGTAGTFYTITTP